MNSWTKKLPSAQQLLSYIARGFYGAKVPTLASSAGLGFYSTSSEDGAEKTIAVEFINSQGKGQTVFGKLGENLLELAHENDIELEGACEGSLACSTCHVVLDASSYKKLPEPSDEENDMLDLAFGLTETSRLGCQVKLRPDLEHLKARLPHATRNMAVDGYKPKPH